MDIVAILKKGDAREVAEALAEIHREKSFALADTEFDPSARKTAAMYHAYHIALMSVIVPEVKTEENSVTGRDYSLAKAFREKWATCGEIPQPQDEFYRMVVEKLNALIKRLCSPH